MENVIETRRLWLVKLQDIEYGSKHLQWFHELWSDDVATSWSIRGKCNTVQESQAWMIECQTKLGYSPYGVFEKRGTSGGWSAGDPGTLLGSVGLRCQESGPTVAPPLPDSSKKINLRVMGYSYFRSSWGKGYATEAGKALLSAYRESVTEEKEKGEEVFYVEAAVGKENPASIRVLKNLGFQDIGWKMAEPVFLAGAWRNDGYGVMGLCV